MRTVLAIVARAALLAGIALALLGGVSRASSGKLAYTCIIGGRLSGPDLHFRAADGTRLVGHRFGKGRTTVVLAHQSGGTLCDWVAEARRLARQGFSALVFDFRGYGHSQDGGLESLPLDVAAAVKEARTLGAKRVLLAGASMGGWAVVMAAPDVQPRVQGVVAVSAPAEWAGSAVEAVGKLTLPVLYLTARSDTSVPSNNSRTLYKATASKHKQLAVVPGVVHGTLLLDMSKPARTTFERFLHKYGKVPSR